MVARNGEEGIAVELRMAPARPEKRLQRGSRLSSTKTHAKVVESGIWGKDMSEVLQSEVTLDEAVLSTVATYRNGCNYAIYFHGGTARIGYGCDGVLVNLQTGHKKLLHDWFIKQHNHGDKTPDGFSVPLLVSPETILELKKREPCSICGAPYFRATSDQTGKTTPDQS